MNLKKKLTTPAGTAFVSAVAIGFLVHLFALINVIHNYDSVFCSPYGYGTGIESGRFALTILGELAKTLRGNTNLPLVNGVMLLVLIGVSAGFLVDTLSVRSCRSAALIGILLAVFPTSASIMIHRFTVVYYGICLVLAVMAAWVLGRSRYGLIWSAICTAISMGIYQALVPVTISILVLLLIQQALRGDSNLPAIIKRGLYYCAALLAGLGLYFLLLKICLAVWHVELLDYQGINQMGRLSLRDLPGQILSAVKLVLFLPMQDQYGITATACLKLGYLLLGGASALMMGYILVVKVKKVTIAISVAVLSFLFLLAVNFIQIQCPESQIYTLMVYSFALLACAPIVIFECLPPEEGDRARLKALMAKGLGTAVLVLILSYSYLNNANYTAIYYADQQVVNYLSSMVTQIRMTEGFRTDMKWAFVGEIKDPLYWFAWGDEMTYGGFTGPDDMLNCHSTYNWMMNYLGVYPPLESEERVAELIRTEEFKAMPCWPNAGSIKAIGNTMVIKCEDVTPEQ